MLKRIRPTETELGMFIYKLEGSWFKHPFWKSRFLLEDPQTLADLKASEIDGVIIDISKGKDLSPSRPEQSCSEARLGRYSPTSGTGSLPVAPARRIQRHGKQDSERDDNLRSTAPLSTKREFGNSKLVAGKGRKVISKIFLEARLGKAIDTNQIEPVVEDIFASLQRNAHTFNGLMRCKNDNEYVYRHLLSTSALMVSLARQMKLSMEEIHEAGMAGLLMDIGVVHLPVDKATSDGDYRSLPQEIRSQHAILGHNVLKAAGDIPDRVLNVCLQHHELMDGSGYPSALKGLEIDMFSRMAAICDRYDNMASGSAEQTAMDPASVLECLVKMGEQLDQEIVQHLIDAVGVHPVGSIVRLRSDRLAMVVDQTPSDPDHPVVRTFYSLALHKRIAGENIDLANCFGADEIVGTASLEELDLPELAQMRETILTRSIQG